MLKILVKSKISAFFASISNTGTKKSNKKPRPKALSVLLIILFAFLVVYMMFAIGAMCFGMELLALETGDTWFAPTLVSLISVSLCLLGSVFTTKTQIFESKDNDLLLSMPIPPRAIFLSRIILLLIVNYALEAIIMLPYIAVHFFVAGITLTWAFCTLAVVLLLPFLSLSVSVLLAWIISIISSKIKNKTLVSVLFTVLFMVVYIMACGSFGALVGSGELDSAEIDLSGFKNSYIFYWMGSAMGEGNFLNLLYFTLCTVACALVTFYLLNRSFVKIITTKRGERKIAYKAKSEKTSSQFVALINKEMKRFFTSSAYILNAGIGNVMTVVLAIMLAVVAPDLMAELGSEPIVARLVPTMISMVIIIIASMNFVSTPSISLEDKNLWILQTCPIDPKQILMAKVTTHIIICAPLTMLSALIVSLALKMSALDVISLVIASLSIVAFTAYFGLWLGLKFPKFDWQNETVAVKQGFAVFGSMFGSMIWSMIFLFAGIFLSALAVPFYVIGIIFTLANALVCFIIHKYFAKGGSVRFANLQHY